MISMHHQGLNPQISCGLAARNLIADAVKVAFQMEGVKKKTPTSPLVNNVTRTERSFVNPIRISLTGLPIYS